MLAHCDYCDNEFEPTLEHKDNGDITKTFFRCDSCGEEYTVYFKDDKVKQLQDEIRLQYEIMRAIRVPNARLKLMDEIDAKEQEVKKLMVKLRYDNLGEW